MSTAQKFGVGLFYTAIALLGAAYGFFETHQANRLVHFTNEMMPSFLILILLVVIYGFFRTAFSVLRELNGVSQAAHATLHMAYGKK